MIALQATARHACRTETPYIVRGAPPERDHAGGDGDTADSDPPVRHCQDQAQCDGRRRCDGALLIEGKPQRLLIADGRKLLALSAASSARFRSGEPSGRPATEDGHAARWPTPRPRRAGREASHRRLLPSSRAPAILGKRFQSFADEESESRQRRRIAPFRGNRALFYGDIGQSGSSITNNQ